MARKGAAAQIVGPEPFLCLWRHVLQREIRKPVEHKRSQFWMETGRLRQANGGRLRPQNVQGFNSLRQKSLRLLTGFLTGQSNLQRHLHKLGIVDDAADCVGLKRKL